MFDWLARVNWLQRSLLTAIAVALVGTQSLGLYHRIEHSTSGWLGSSSPARLVGAVLADAPPAPGGVAEHDCAAIDALALAHGASPPGISFHAMAPVAADVASCEQPNPVVTALRPFQARAPPLVLS